MQDEVAAFGESRTPVQERLLIYGTLPDGTEEMALGWKGRSDGLWYYAPQGGLVPFKVRQWAVVPPKEVLNLQSQRDVKMIGEPFPIERTPFLLRLLGQKRYRQYAMLRMPVGEIIGVFMYRDRA